MSMENVSGVEWPEDELTVVEHGDLLRAMVDG